MDTAQDLEAFLGRMADAAWTLSATRCALEAGLLDDLAEARSIEEISARASLPPAFVESVFGVLTGAGVVRREEGGFTAAPAVTAALATPMRDFIQADLASHQWQGADIVRLGRQGAGALEGWKHIEGDLLEAQGTRSAFLPVGWARQLFPSLDGLVDRLAMPTARALDVGTGVGRLAISLCQQYPSVRVVGIDPYDVPLARARANVERAGMGERIELRQAVVQDLTEQAAYDLIWVPTFFLPAAVLAAAIPPVFRALRPGGWTIFGCLAAGANALQAAVFRLVALAWGGEAYPGTEVGEQLREAGFTDLRLPAPPPGVPMQFAAARRPDRQS